MSATRLAFLLLALSALGHPGGAQAQEQAPENPRQGFWISFGLGLGAQDVECEPLCVSTPASGGLGGLLGLGGTLGGRWLVGVEVVSLTPWAAKELYYGPFRVAEDGYSALLLGARYYLSDTGNTYLSAGIGSGDLTLVENRFESTGFAVQVAAGLDLRTWRRYSLTPYVVLHHSFGHETEVRAEKVEGTVQVRFLQLGMAFTMH